MARKRKHTAGKPTRRFSHKKNTTKSATKVQGKFIGNPRGFGFVTPDQGGEDIFIPPNAINNAIDGDIVLCEISKEETTPERSRKVGKIIEVKTRANNLVGAFFVESGKGIVRPVDTKNPNLYYVSKEDVKAHALVDGHRVIFNPQATSGKKRLPQCQITEVIGHIHDPGTDVMALVRQAGIPHSFSKIVNLTANALPETVLEEELTNRLDLRNQFIFTIDGDDTKDIDDAISFEVAEDGTINLGVHIADVTHYVKEFSALDDAAFERGTSVYLADRVIPMLPHRLSSGICSLLPDVDRLALSCFMTVSPQGLVTDYKIANTVINSKMRFTYNQVQEILDGAKSPYTKLVKQMDKLRKTLAKNRRTKGALDFNIPEAKIRVDETGWPISIEPHSRTPSTAIIEEFMILCNETIAQHFLVREAPFIFRTHQTPSDDKVEKLRTLTKQLGFRLPKGLESPLTLQRLIDRTAKTAAAATIATAVLHSLPQARYTPDDPAHYGLASSAYCHFTSPIRRYADLTIHRIIKDWLAGHNLNHYHEALDTIATQCSQTERAAETLEREVAQLKKVQFMEDQQGKTFEATVSGVTHWGIYVMLPNTVEGIIPAETLKRRQFTFDKDHGVYTAKARKGKSATVLRHGSPLAVRLVETLEDERKLVFNLAPEKFHKAL